MNRSSDSSMFVILTSKPGQFRTESVEGLNPIEAYDYIFYGKKKAHFVIAELLRPVKVRVVDEAPPPVVNHIPSKFLSKFGTLEEARRELQQLKSAHDTDTNLVQVQRSV